MNFYGKLSRGFVFLFCFVLLWCNFCFFVCLLWMNGWGGEEGEGKGEVEGQGRKRIEFSEESPMFG